MSALSIQSTFPIITDIDGQPLEDGYIWLGVAGSGNPVANPQTAYWDAALTQTVTQPVRTRGGYPMNAGVPGRLYVNGDYSIRIDNRNGSTIYSATNATERYDNTVVTGIDSSEVTFIQAGIGAVTRTAQAKMRDVVSVKDFGAVGDGVTDDTAAIQAAIDAASSGAEVVFPGSGPYKITSTITINKGISIASNGARILCSGTSAFLNINGTGIVGLTFDGLIFYGDGTTGNTPAGGVIQSPSGTETENLTIQNCTFKDVSFGVAINSNLSGFHKRPSVVNCRFTNIVGSGSGTGVGLNLAGGNTAVMDAVVSGNIFDTVGRHSLYVSSGSNINITGNVFKSQSNATDRVAACAVARARNVLVSGNAFFANSVGVSVEPAESAVSAQSHPDSKTISVVGNLFRDTERYDVVIGTSDTASGTRGLYAVTVRENLIFKTGANDYAAIWVQNGNQISVEQNYIDAINISVAYAFGAIHLTAVAVTGQTSSDYAIRNNIIRCSNIAGSRGINLGDSAVKSISLLIQNNDISAPTKIHNYSSMGASTRTSAGLTGLVGVYTAGDTTPSVNGVSFMRIANSGATSITNFDDGVDGQVLTLSFGDANTTITRNNAYFVGGVNYTSGTNQTLVLVYFNGGWYELGRASPT